MHSQDSGAGQISIDPAQPDLQLALQGLRNSLLAVQQEIARLDGSLLQLQGHRRQLLENQVARLLPDLSGATLDALVLACPGFVDEVVRGVFRDKRKLFGLFTRSGTDAALTSLKTRLAFYLDTHKSDELRNADELLSRESEARQHLDKLRYEVQAAIRMLEKYQASGQPLPADVQAYVSELAARARRIAARQVGGPADSTGPEYDNNNYSYQDNSAAYPWLYFSQDINHNYSYETAPAPHAPEPRDNGHGHGTHPEPDNCSNDVPASAGAQACLTDDSLGAYS